MTAEPGSLPAYRIVTPRLVVRCWEPVDAPLMKEAIESSIEHLLPWMPWASAEPEELQKKIDLLRHFRGQFDLGVDFVYGIFDRDETAVIGGTGLHTRVGEGAREIGYWIRVAEIGKGYATEAASALTRVGFELEKLRRIEIHCDAANVRSASVPRKLGYTHEATLRRRIPGRDSDRDQMVWTMLIDEYPGSPASQVPVAAFDVIGREIE